VRHRKPEQEQKQRDHREGEPGEENPARPEHLGGLASRGLRDGGRQVQRGDQCCGLAF
jgi:hypothetical protein